MRKTVIHITEILVPVSVLEVSVVIVDVIIVIDEVATVEVVAVEELIVDVLEDSVVTVELLDVAAAEQQKKANSRHRTSNHVIGARAERVTERVIGAIWK